MKLLIQNEISKFIRGGKINYIKGVIFVLFIAWFNYFTWRNQNVISITLVFTYAWNKYIVYLFILVVNLILMYFLKSQNYTKEELFQLRINKWHLISFDFVKLILLNVILFNSVFYMIFKIEQFHLVYVLCLIFINTYLLSKNLTSLALNSGLTAIYWLLLLRSDYFMFLILVIEVVSFYLFVIKNIKVNIKKGNKIIHPKNVFLESIIYVLRAEKNFKLLFIVLILMVVLMIVPEKFQYVVVPASLLKKVMMNTDAKAVFVKYPNITLLQIVFFILYLVNNMKLYIVTKVDNYYTKYINPNVYSHYFIFVFIITLLSLVQSIVFLPFNHLAGVSSDLSTMMKAIANGLLWVPFALLFVTILKKRSVFIVIIILVIFFSSNAIVDFIHLNSLGGSILLIVLELGIIFTMIFISKNDKKGIKLWNN